MASEKTLAQEPLEMLVEMSPKSDGENHVESAQSGNHYNGLVSKKDSTLETLSSEFLRLSAFG